MKVIMPFGRAMDYEPRHPERTARRTLSGVFGEVEFKEWTNRTAMARSIRMQERAGTSGAWHACIALSPGEGY